MVYDFVYYTPTKVVFGKDKVDETGALLKEFGARKVLIHYGSHHAVKSGLIARIKKQLDAEGIASVELGGVVPNPRISLARKGVELCKAEKVDFLLAVGGGSVIDSCKAIGYALFNGGDPWDFYDGTRKPAGCTPIGAVLTIAAAGSEMSDSSVLTNEDGWLKRGCNSDYCRCKFAIEDPMLTMSLPAYQTACGVTDILMHTMERYFCHAEGSHLTDEIAEGIMRAVKEAGLTLVKDPGDYDARSVVMFGSSLSHNNLTAMGNASRGDWACHQLEHELGGMFDCAHGAGLAALWPTWARYVEKRDPGRFIRFGKQVFGIDAKNAEDTIRAVEAFYRQMGMPTNMKELGIQPTDKQIDELTEKATNFGKRTLGDFMVLHAKEIHDIYTRARG